MYKPYYFVADSFRFGFSATKVLVIEANNTYK